MIVVWLVYETVAPATVFVCLYQRSGVITQQSSKSCDKLFYEF